MDIATLLHSHIYTAIVPGSVVEGESTVVLTGFAAHQGYAPWWAVTLMACTINFVLDQSLFALGRWRGDWILDKLPRLREGVHRIAPLIHRHRRWMVFGVRFMYGLRTAGPLARGMARIPWSDFVIFNALGADVWANVFSGLGYHDTQAWSLRSCGHPNWCVPTQRTVWCRVRLREFHGSKQGSWAMRAILRLRDLRVTYSAAML